MAKTKLLVADNSYLIRQGIRSIVEEVKDFSLVGEADTAISLTEKLIITCPDVLIIDYTSTYFCTDDISVIKMQYPSINILAITNKNIKSIISKAFQDGVTSHLLKDCGKEEIIEAIRNTAKGQQFLCGKIVDIIIKENTDEASIAQQTKVSCDGIKVSTREIEIIQLVADGLSNKQIADKLFLSVHTITTHRKNIMSKLGVNNTAGLLMFAIRENIIGSEKFMLASQN